MREDVELRTASSLKIPINVLEVVEAIQELFKEYSLINVKNCKNFIDHEIPKHTLDTLRRTELNSL